MEKDGVYFLFFWPKHFLRYKIHLIMNQITHNFRQDLFHWGDFFLISGRSFGKNG